jgi:hypothetical protein
MSSEPPNLAAFVASLSGAWHAGEIRPTFSLEAKPRYLRSLQRVSLQTTASSSLGPPKPKSETAPAIKSADALPKPKPIYAQPGKARIQALRTVWPIVFRRLEALPNINAMQLFEELCVQFPGRFTVKQYRTLLRRVNRWRQDARARGVVIGPKTYRRAVTNGGVRVRISLKTTGKRWCNILRKVLTRPPLSFLSSSRLGTPADTACGNSTPCRSGSENGDKRRSSGSSLMWAAKHETCLLRPHQCRSGNILNEASGNKVR